MQTVLESLESAYINILNLQEESKRNINFDTYINEELYDSYKELTKSIILLVTDDNLNLIPSDSRVYRDIVDNNDTFKSADIRVQDKFIEKMYKCEIFHKELTVADLIEKLQEFAPNLKVSVCGNANKLSKFVVDDTYLDKVILVPVEQ